MPCRIWLDIVYDWVAVGRHVIVLHYEDFLSDPVPQLNRVLQFLQLPVDPARLQCIRESSFDQWKRQGGGDRFKHGAKKNPFDKHEKLKKEFDEAIEDVNAFLLKTGHRQMPLDKYKYYKR